LARIALYDVPETGSRIVELDGKRVLICRTASGIRAINEICPHQQLSLEGGRIRGGVLMCPHHGARFSLEDGKSLSPLTPKGLTLYPVREIGDELEIDI
jgi:nitrite reductase/ring-hydroxylating ferredoxin subunit